MRLLALPLLSLRSTMLRYTASSSSSPGSSLLPPTAQEPGDYAWQRYTCNFAGGQQFTALWRLRQAHHARCSLQLKLVCRVEHCGHPAKLLDIWRASSPDGEQCARTLMRMFCDPLDRLAAVVSDRPIKHVSLEEMLRSGSHHHLRLMTEQRSLLWLDPALGSNALEAPLGISLSAL